jgi:hypothetical protein
MQHASWTHSNLLTISKLLLPGVLSAILALSTPSSRAYAEVPSWAVGPIELLPIGTLLVTGCGLALLYQTNVQMQNYKQCREFQSEQRGDQCAPLAKRMTNIADWVEHPVEKSAEHLAAPAPAPVKKREKFPPAKAPGWETPERVSSPAPPNDPTEDSTRAVRK